MYHLNGHKASNEKDLGVITDNITNFFTSKANCTLGLICFIIYLVCFTVQVCRTPGPIACSKTMILRSHSLTSQSKHLHVLSGHILK